MRLFPNSSDEKLYIGMSVCGMKRHDKQILGGRKPLRRLFSIRILFPEDFIVIDYLLKLS